MGPIVSVLINQLHCCREKLVIDNTNQYGHVAVHFLHKTGGRLGLAHGPQAVHVNGSQHLGGKWWSLSALKSDENYTSFLQNNSTRLILYTTV